MITLKLLDTVPQIEDKVNSAISEQINLLLFQKQSTLLNSAKNMASTWISSQPEMLSLQSSSSFSLAGQFGLYAGSGSSVVNAIKNSITNSVSVSFKKFSKKLVGGLEINFQPKNFINLLTLPEGIVNYERGSLPWLEWLLTKGDSIIVTSYIYYPSTGLGRSGLGNMTAGGSFRVPPEFSGMDSDNFVTRALIGPNQEKELTDLFRKILT